MLIKTVIFIISYTFIIIFPQVRYKNPNIYPFRKQFKHLFEILIFINLQIYHSL